jgi:hypothetical protein
MRKELIPFDDRTRTLAFQQEHGGSLAGYGVISTETIKLLMGGMHMPMPMKGHGQGHAM